MRFVLIAALLTAGLMAAVVGAVNADPTTRNTFERTSR